MKSIVEHQFSNKKVTYYFDYSFKKIDKYVSNELSVIITDDNIFKNYKSLFKNRKVIIINAGEKFKNQNTINLIIDKMIELGVDRTYTLVGVGGGVVTDISGYVSSIYMRGIKCVFFPTSILAMVDASIGGKNGIDVGVYKNMIGSFKQPDALFFDFNFLKTLPRTEWINGFAEIIKHACIKDKAMFLELEKRNINFYMNSVKDTKQLIAKNVSLKTKVVKNDEFEKNERMLLNFGHTLGHAIENYYDLLHGQAISIGMVYASLYAEKLVGFKDVLRVTSLLEKYELPIDFKFDKLQTFKRILKDKKKSNQIVNYILLKSIGKGITFPIDENNLKKIILKT